MTWEESIQKDIDEELMRRFLIMYYHTYLFPRSHKCVDENCFSVSEVAS